MITFRGRVSLPKLDAKKFNKTLKDNMDVQMRHAARAWLMAVIPKVPVWAGTSRGSLKPLGRFLRVAIPISPSPTARGGPNRGPEAGERMGNFAFEHRAQRFLFKFRTDVPHFILNEYYNMDHIPWLHLIEKTPWNAFLAGKVAFDAYVKNELPKRIPKIKDYIKYKSVRLEP